MLLPFNLHFIEYSCLIYVWYPMNICLKNDSKVSNIFLWWAWNHLILFPSSCLASKQPSTRILISCYNFELLFLFSSFILSSLCSSLINNGPCIIVGVLNIEYSYFSAFYDNRMIFSEFVLSVTKIKFLPSIQKNINGK